jgi:hypothetical protein
MKFQEFAVKSNEGNGNFLKLPANEPVELLLRGELYQYWQIWPEGGEKQIFDKPTAGAQMRFKANVVVTEEGKAVVKLWDFPVTVNNMLFKIARHNDLTATKIEVTKEVQGKRTSYMVVALDKVDPKKLKALESLKLTEFAPAESAPVKNHAPGADDDSGDLPF